MSSLKSILGWRIRGFVDSIFASVMEVSKTVFHISTANGSAAKVMFFDFLHFLTSASFLFCFVFLTEKCGKTTLSINFIIMVCFISNKVNWTLLLITKRSSLQYMITIHEWQQFTVKTYTAWGNNKEGWRDKKKTPSEPRTGAKTITRKSELRSEFCSNQNWIHFSTWSNIKISSIFGF